MPDDCTACLFLMKTGNAADEMFGRRVIEHLSAAW